jgi:FKBP-type peptidyl-prolyl cis-trans isomerase FklB
MNMRLNLLALATSGALALTALAADSGELKEPKQKFSYGLGMSLGNNLKRSGIAPDQIDTELVVRAIKDAMGGTNTLLSETEARTAIMDFQREARTQLGEKNKKAGVAFLEENKKKEGVKIHPVTLPTGTAELQYKILTPGDGQSPKTNDMVTVNYRGTLVDGTEFDSSYKRGQPATFPVNGVIRGWTEALQLMKPGAKWQLFIPPELGYGERGSGAAIGPNATLVFEVEMVSAQPKPAPPAAPGEPVTSDIIKVPSKEELDKGAKIEVIKASELEKYKAAEKAKTNAPATPK